MPHNQPMADNANPSVANTTPAGGPREDLPTSSHEAGTASITMATSVPQNGPRYKSRSIVFTMYDLTLVDKLQRYAQTETEYMRFGRETCPTTGRQHLQGWLQWAGPRQVHRFWEAFGHPHIQPRKGSVLSNQTYTAKEGDWWEHGTPPAQGERTDWKTAVEQLRTQRVVEVVDTQPHLLPAIRALERYAVLSRQPPKDRDVRTIYIHGRSGCGKSRALHQAYPDAYWKPQGDWWDGYEGQAVVVLDDYYGDQPYAQLLRVLDRYPLRLPVKGGFVPAAFTTVVITSNARLDDQYPSITGTKREPLYRRIHRVISADDGVSPEHITDALQAPPQHPQVHHQAIQHPHWSPPDHAPHPEGSG